MDQALLDEAVDELRAMVALDGGDVELVTATDTQVDLRLILEGAECRECVMPKQFLEQIALDLVTTRIPSVNTIAIDDPRDSV